MSNKTDKQMNFKRVDLLKNKFDSAFTKTERANLTKIAYQNGNRPFQNEKQIDK